MNQPVIAMRSVNPRRLSAEAAARAYWPHAVSVAIAMILIIGVRLHEFLPFAEALQLVPLLGIGGTALVISRSGTQAIGTVLRSRLTVLVLCYFAFALVTAPFALWPKQAFENVQMFMPSVLMFVTLASCPPTRQSLRRLQWGMIAVVLAYAVYAKFAGHEIADGRWKVEGGMYDSNDMAVMMNIGFLMAFGMVLRERGWKRVAGVVCAAAFVGTLVMSGSRGGVIGFAAGVVVLIVALPTPHRIVGLIAVTITATIAWSMADHSFRSRITTLNNLEQDYNTTAYTGRKLTWKRGLMYFRQNPIAGVGAGNFPIAEGRYLAGDGRRGKWSAAHNAYIQAAAELGAPGFLLFAGMLLTAFGYAGRLWGRRTSVPSPELLACLISVAVGAIFLSHAFFPPLFALLGMSVLAYQIAIREPRRVVFRRMPLRQAAGTRVAR